MRSLSNSNSPSISRREFFMALWSLRVVRWTAAFFVAAIGGMALWAKTKALPGQAWGTASLPVLLVVAVIVFVSLTIAFGGLLQWSCSFHLPLTSALALVLLSSAMVVVYFVAKLRGFEGLLTCLFGLLGAIGLSLGVVHSVQLFYKQENTPHRTAMIATATNSLIWLGTFIANGEYHKMEYPVITVLVNMLLNFGLFYYFTKSGAMCVLAFREGLQGERTTLPNHT